MQFYSYIKNSSYQQNKNACGVFAGINKNKKEEEIPMERLLEGVLTANGTNKKKKKHLAKLESSISSKSILVPDNMERRP